MLTQKGILKTNMTKMLNRKHTQVISTQMTVTIIKKAIQITTRMSQKNNMMVMLITIRMQMQLIIQIQMSKIMTNNNTIMKTIVTQHKNQNT